MSSTESQNKFDAEIQRYLQTGKHDMLFLAWPAAENSIERMIRGHRDLQQALLAEVHRRTASVHTSTVIQDLDGANFIRRKTEPMIRGLFPGKEQENVLSLVAKAVVFLTPANIDSIIMNSGWLSSAWQLANMYLTYMQVEPLSRDAPQAVGLSENLQCFVSPEYFDEKCPFADYIVHETAHLFHNCRRSAIGLPETRQRKYLLNIHFAKREVFAYASEAWSQIYERSSTIAGRRELAGQFNGFGVDDCYADPVEVVAVVRNACSARNGWKFILSHCREDPFTES